MIGSGSGTSMEDTRETVDLTSSGVSLKLVEN